MLKNIIKDDFFSLIGDYSVHQALYDFLLYKFYCPVRAKDRGEKQGQRSGSRSSRLDWSQHTNGTLFIHPKSIEGNITKKYPY